MKNLLGKKLGMTHIFDKNGNFIPVTVVLAGPCYVTAIRTQEKNGYKAIQVGFLPTKKLNKPISGNLKDEKLKLKYLVEFKVGNPEEYQIGQEIKLDVFKPGDVVKVSGKSIGKGTQGNIKRWHHHRSPMSHGSKSHRIPGSIGAGTTPGRVYKGRKMPGHMGSVNVTTKGLQIVQVDSDRGVLLIKGSVPGPSGSILEIVNQ